MISLGAFMPSYLSCLPIVVNLRLIGQPTQTRQNLRVFCCLLPLLYLPQYWLQPNLLDEKSRNLTITDIEYRSHNIYQFVNLPISVRHQIQQDHAAVSLHRPIVTTAPQSIADSLVNHRLRLPNKWDEQLAASVEKLIARLCTVGSLQVNKRPLSVLTANKCIHGLEKAVG